MKKLLCLILGLVLILSFVGCNKITNTTNEEPKQEEPPFTLPEDCCVVSVPAGFDLCNSNAETFIYLENAIEGIEWNKDRTYYAVTENAEFEIVHFNKNISDDKAKGKGKVITGFEVGETVLSYNPSESNTFKLTVSESADINPVYTDYNTVGLIIFVGEKGEKLWEKACNVADCFNTDGSIKELYNVYYVIEYEDSFEMNRYWDSNLEITKVDYSNATTTYQAYRIMQEEGQQLFYCILNRYGDNYFVGSGAYGDNYTSALTSMTIGIRQDHKLVVYFDKRPEPVA